jgi:hypothetical protein
MTKLYIDFHDAAINTIVGSNYKLNQFVTWDDEKTFFVYEFGTDQRVCQVDRFTIEIPCELYDAKLHAKSYFADLFHFDDLFKRNVA